LPIRIKSSIREAQHLANQAKIETQRKAFDQMMYERSMTPALSEKQVLEENRRVTRMMTTPQPAEITKGLTLNTFMPFIQRLAFQGVQGPPIPLNPDALRRVNVTTGDGGLSIGILRNQPIPWPMALRGETQRKLDPMLKSAVSQATTNSLEPGPYKQVQSMVKQLEDEFFFKFKNEQISTSDWLVETPFIENLKIAVRALGLPEASRLLDGTYAARGNNVPELVANMTGGGLTFAPANPGDETVYRSLNAAFTNYIRAAQSASGMQLQLRPSFPSSQVKN